MNLNSQRTKMTTIQFIKSIRPTKGWWIWTIGLGLFAIFCGDTNRRPVYMNFILAETFWLIFNLWIVTLSILMFLGKQVKNPVGRLWAVGGILLFLLISLATTVILALRLTI